MESWQYKVIFDIVDFTSSLRGLSFDASGCDFNNRYEIATYGFESSDSIRVKVRHYEDSYIAAEEATKGCSSKFIFGVNCVTKLLATKNYQIKLNSGVSPQSTEDNSLSTMSKVSLGVQFWSENFSSIEGTCALFFIFIGIYYLLYWWCCDPS